MSFYADYIGMVHRALCEVQVTDSNRKLLDREQGLTLWNEWTHELKKNNHTMYFVGNGASCTMASHMSADATKNGGIRAKTFNDQSLMTAIGNDIAYDEVFSFPLNRFGDEGDILVTISSSGNSPNIIKAIEVAVTKKIKVITLSGMKEDNKSRAMGDLNFWLPAPYYGVVESCHQVLLHSWLDNYLFGLGRMI